MKIIAAITKNLNYLGLPAIARNLIALLNKIICFLVVLQFVCLNIRFAYNELQEGGRLFFLYA